MKNTRYQVSKSVLESIIRPFAVRMIHHGASKIWAETALVYVSNMFLGDSCQSRNINSSLLKRNVRVIPKAMVDAGVLEREGNYRAGHHSYQYLLTREFQAQIKEVWLKAVEVDEVRFDVRYGPNIVPPAEALEEEVLCGIHDILSQLDLRVDVPLVNCINFIQDPTMMMHLERYISKLRTIEMEVNVAEVLVGISHGVQLIRNNPEGSPESARGFAYIYTGQSILDRTKNGIFRPHYFLREFRFFENGFQQYPSLYNKADLIDDPDYINIDQVTAHASIILQMMKKLGLEAGPIQEYVEDREGVMAKLGLEKDPLKAAMNAFLNGAKVGPNIFFNKRTGAPLACFLPFYEAYHHDNAFGSKDLTLAIQKYMIFVRWLQPAKKNIKELSHHAELILKDPRRDGTNLGYIAQLVELGHKAVYAMTNKVNLVADAHDGMILDTLGNWNRSTVEANELTGYVLDYVEKPLGGSRKDKDTRADYDSWGRGWLTPEEEKVGFLGSPATL